MQVRERFQDLASGEERTAKALAEGGGEGKGGGELMDAEVVCQESPEPAGRTQLVTSAVI